MVEPRPLRFVAYAPTETHNARNKLAFWTSLDRAVEEVPKHEYIRTYVRVDECHCPHGEGEKEQMGSKDNQILGAYDRDILNDNWELLLFFASNHGLALVNTFFSRRGKKRIDYIITRQRDRKLVRNVTVHPQPSFLPISAHNTVSALVKLLGHFAQNRRVKVLAKTPDQWTVGAW